MKTVRQKNKTSLFFVAIFLVVIAFTIFNNILREKSIRLNVLDNAGVSVLETSGDKLISVFQDGQVGVWSWNNLSQQIADFTIVSDRAVILDPDTMAAVSKTRRKLLSFYSIPDGQKQKDLNVGWEDQDVWLRISPDKKVLALIRRNTPDSKQNVLFEFLTVDIDKQIVSLPVTLSIAQDVEDFVDYAVDNRGVLIAAGSQKDLGRVVALDLHNGKVLWDTTLADTKEFCSVETGPQKDLIYAGSRDGFLYQINAATGNVAKKIQLLQDGETRPITNDYSVLNLAFSPNGQTLAATITPKAYLLKTNDNKIIFASSTGAMLTSKTAFSPDGQFFATSDIRASKPIIIHKMPQEK